MVLEKGFILFFFCNLLFIQINLKWDKSIPTDPIGRTILFCLSFLQDYTAIHNLTVPLLTLHRCGRQNCKNAPHTHTNMSSLNPRTCEYNEIDISSVIMLCSVAQLTYGFTWAHKSREFSLDDGRRGSQRHLKHENDLLLWARKSHLYYKKECRWPSGDKGSCPLMISKEMGTLSTTSTTNWFLPIAEIMGKMPSFRWQQSQLILYIQPCDTLSRESSHVILDFQLTELWVKNAFCFKLLSLW